MRNGLNTHWYGKKRVQVLNCGGEPWFLLPDICQILSLSTTDVASRLGDDRVMPGPFKGATEIWVSVDGVFDILAYACISKRSLSEKYFRHWLKFALLLQYPRYGEEIKEQVRQLREAFAKLDSAGVENA